MSREEKTMVNLAETIAPRSDQLNSDDLIAGPRTIVVTGVNRADGDQPIAVNFEGDNGKPWKPCKSMRRVLVQIWGPDGAAYAGRSLTIYRDPGVVFGGVAVGGIRISHASHINKAITMALTATQKARKPFTVEPLRNTAPAPVALSIRDIIQQRLQAATNVQEVIAVGDSPEVRKVMDKAPPDVKAAVNAMLADAFQRHQPQQPVDDVPNLDDFLGDREVA